jgi:hypothetical protein
MAHFAEIDQDNIVLRVIVCDDSNDGLNFLQQIGGRWIQTSYNTQGGVHLLGSTPLRKNYAGVGFTYDESRDAFIAPKPYPSWILDETSCQWIPPVEMPTDGLSYSWNEGTLSWDLINQE